MQQLNLQLHQRGLSCRLHHERLKVRKPNVNSPTINELWKYVIKLWPCVVSVVPVHLNMEDGGRRRRLKQSASWERERDGDVQTANYQLSSVSPPPPHPISPRLSLVSRPHSAPSSLFFLCSRGCCLSKMAYQELQSGETLATLKRESETLKKKLEVERGRLNDIECKCPELTKKTTIIQLTFYLKTLVVVYWKHY